MTRVLPRSSPRISTRSGFTLLEVIIALGLMVMIGMMAWSTLAGAMQLRDYMQDADATDRSARVALDRISRELELAYLSDTGTTTTTSTTYQTVFVGRDEGESDVLWFTTTSHRRSYRDSRECDQAEITLWTEPDPNNSSWQVLLHRENGQIDAEPDVGGAIMPIAAGVSRFELRYFDGTTAEWRDEWDTTGVETTNRLPRAVQVVLGLMEPDPDNDEEFVERLFVRTLIVERAEATTRSALAGDGGGDGAIGEGLQK